MRRIVVFGLSTIGAVTLLAGMGVAGAAALWSWHSHDGCSVMSRQYRVDLGRGARGVRVETRPAGGTAGCEEGCADAFLLGAPPPPPLPAPLATVAPAAAPAPTVEDRLAAILSRLEALESRLAERAPAAPVAPPASVPAPPVRSDEF